jgi:hypothetical protein
MSKFISNFDHTSTCHFCLGREVLERIERLPFLLGLINLVNDFHCSEEAEVSRNGWNFKSC